MNRRLIEIGFLTLVFIIFQRNTVSAFELFSSYSFTPNSTCIDGKLIVTDKNSNEAIKEPHIKEYSIVNGVYVEKEIHRKGWEETVYYNPNVSGVFIKDNNLHIIRNYMLTKTAQSKRSRIMSASIDVATLVVNFNNYYAALCQNGYKDYNTNIGLMNLTYPVYTLELNLKSVDDYNLFQQSYLKSPAYLEIINKHLPMINTSPTEALKALEDNSVYSALETDLKKFFLIAIVGNTDTLKSISQYELNEDYLMALASQREEQKQHKAKRDEEEKQLKAKNERIMSVPLPVFDNGNTAISVHFDGDKLIITNKTTEFITVKTVSTYYNNQISTLKDANKEYAPESTDRDGILKYLLFSNDMNKSGEYIFKDQEKVKLGSTTFGFAIKYSINGKDYNLYKVNTYQNSSLIK